MKIFNLKRTGGGTKQPPPLFPHTIPAKPIQKSNTVKTLAKYPMTRKQQQNTQLLTPTPPISLDSSFEEKGASDELLQDGRQS